MANIKNRLGEPKIEMSIPYGASLFSLGKSGINDDEAYSAPYGTQVDGLCGYHKLSDQVQNHMMTPNITGNVDFEGISFNYPLRPEAEILKNFNLSLKQGTSLAVVGPSGSGKSTLVSLLTRLYDPQHGSIKIDGVDIRQIDPHWLRRRISVVAQEPALFSCTIEDNIRYGAPGASPEHVKLAAQQANAHAFISKFPDGYKTIVGER
jgi:ABC-type multidrug transport system fused ATPase/permease subunit